MRQVTILEFHFQTSQLVSNLLRLPGRAVSQLPHTGGGHQRDGEPEFHEISFKLIDKHSETTFLPKGNALRANTRIWFDLRERPDGDNFTQVVHKVKRQSQIHYLKLPIRNIYRFISVFKVVTGEVFTVDGSDRNKKTTKFTFKMCNLKMPGRRGSLKLNLQHVCENLALAGQSGKPRTSSLQRERTNCVVYCVQYSIAELFLNMKPVTIDRRDVPVPPRPCHDHDLIRRLLPP